MSNTKNKNLTITLNSEEYGDLDFLVDYFQEQSISTVTKSDVIKFMLRQMKRTVENDLVKDVNNLIKEAESDNNTAKPKPLSKINVDDE